MLINQIKYINDQPNKIYINSYGIYFVSIFILWLFCSRFNTREVCDVVGILGNSNWIENPCSNNSAGVKVNFTNGRPCTRNRQSCDKS